MTVWTLHVYKEGMNLPVPIVTYAVWGECYLHLKNMGEKSFWTIRPTDIGRGYFNPEPFITIADKYLEDCQYSEGWEHFDYYKAGYERGKNESSVS